MEVNYTIKNNYSKTEALGFRCILDSIEEITRQRPDLGAVLYQDQSYSYRNIDEQSNRFAAYLRGKAVIEADDLIGVLLPKSADLVVVLLGILKSGAAYVPIDVTYPTERIHYILEDCRCKLLVDEAFLAEFKSQAAGISAEDLSVEITENDLAYVIYTSGSTGLPKGVMVTHGNLSSVLWAESQLFHFTPKTCFITNYVFDVSLLEVFFPLVTGGEIVIPERNTSESLTKLLRFMIQNQINILQATPSYLANLLTVIDDSDGRQLSENLRVICVGGESLSDDLVQQLRTKLPTTQLNNHYGPTEASIDALVYQDVKSQTKNIIGKAIANTEVYILDEALQELPVDAVGEICLGGLGITRGYLNRSELTEQKFKVHPVDASQKIYLTGDFGRKLSDGNIEFLGRKDDQVKIRGNRIELSEIEHVSLQMNLIQSAIVLAQEFPDQEKRLVLYAISDQVLDTATVRDFLIQKLPIYMVPDYVIQVEKYPLTSNGKIDKKALPMPQLNDVTHLSDLVLPRNAEEEQVLSLWKEVLGTSSIGVEDHFIELGGHSLKAMHLLSKIHQSMSLQIDLEYIFKYPTIRSFCEHLALISKKSSLSLQPVEPQTHYETTINQKRLWYIYGLNPLSTTQNESITIDFEEHVDVDSLQQALRYLVRRHESFRTNFVEIDGRAMQLIHEDSAFEIPVYDLKNELDPVGKMNEICSQKESYPFKLEQERLFFMSIFKLTEQSWKLNIVIHHILTDGWSDELLKDELSLAYRAFREGESPDLEPLIVQNKDYAAYQKQKLSPEILEANRIYWHETLGGVFPIIELPKDRAYQDQRKNSGSIYKYVLETDLYEQLKKLAVQENTGMFTILLAALQVLMGKWSNSSDLIVSSAFSEREEEQTRKMIGYFISPLMLRATIDPQERVNELLKKAKKSVNDAIKHHDYPIEKLLVDLDIQFDYSKYFVSPISLNMINFTEQDQDPEDQSSGYVGQLSNEVEYEIDFEAIEYPTCLVLYCFYKDELFDLERIEALHQAYRSVLQQFTDHPEAELATIISNI